MPPCTRCHPANPRPATPGYRTCEKCRKKQRDHSARARLQRATNGRYAGLCETCNAAPPDAGSSRCSECRERAYRSDPGKRERTRAVMRDLRAQRIAAGLCTCCGDRPPVRDRRLCLPCGIRIAEIDARRKARKAA